MSLEHFRQVGESQGRGYNISETISSNIDDKTMHELYLWPFADAVRAGVGSIMCSYNQVNNSYSCQKLVYFRVFPLARSTYSMFNGC